MPENRPARPAWARRVAQAGTDSEGAGPAGLAVSEPAAVPAAAAVAATTRHLAMTTDVDLNARGAAARVGSHVPITESRLPVSRCLVLSLRALHNAQL